MTSKSQFPTQPPEPIEAIMRVRFAAPDTALLEELMAENERLKAELAEVES